MSKKCIACLAPLFAVMAFATAPAVSQAAEPHWFVCTHLGGGKGTFADSECQVPLAEGPWAWVKVAEAPKVQVITFGKLKLTTPTITIECKVLDGGNIWNVVAGGLDEILAFTNYECVTLVGTCEKPEIVAKGFPWKTELLAGPIDKITGVKVTVFCGGAELGTFEGELKPKIVNVTEAHPTFAEFTAATGELSFGAVKAKVEGKDKLLTEEGDQVKVE